MAITDKEQGVWDVDQVYNKINQGNIWKYDGAPGEPGGVWSVWLGQYGRLGQNNTTTYSSPVMAPGVYDDSWSGPGSTFGRGTDGTLWAWGANSSGSLGLNDNVQRSVPVQIGTDTDWAKNGARLRFPKTDGTLWTWGPSANGQLGLNQGPADLNGLSSPTQIGAEDTWSQSEYSHGTFHSLKTDGTVWCMGGYWTIGEMGNNQPNGFISSPTQLPGYTFNVLAATGGKSPYSRGGITPTGSLYMWGANASGQLGLNEGPYRAPWQPNWGRTNRDKSTPNSVSGTTWKYIRTGNACAIATKTDGTLWGWGSESDGQLGLNNSGVQYSSPVQVGTDTTWTGKIFLGNSTAAAVKTDGSVWGWGENADGELGQNNRVDYSSPIQITGDWTDMGDGYVLNLIKPG